MTKILNFALKINGGGREGGTCEVLRPCHPPPKFGTCTSAAFIANLCSHLIPVHYKTSTSCTSKRTF